MEVRRAAVGGVVGAVRGVMPADVGARWQTDLDLASLAAAGVAAAHEVQAKAVPPGLRLLKCARLMVGLGCWVGAGVHAETGRDCY